jgi:hypothetical protein
MPPLHFANGVCQGGAREASGLDDHPHPAKVEYESSFAIIFSKGKKVPNYWPREDDAFQNVRK